jgi:hypothetical protein
LLCSSIWGRHKIHDFIYRIQNVCEVGAAAQVGRGFLVFVAKPAGSWLVCKAVVRSYASVGDVFKM